MSGPIQDAANKAALETVKKDKPQSFTVGAHYRDGQFIAETTYDRKLSNLWGLTAYARAYWHDLPVTVNGTTATVKKPTGEAGVELTRKF